MRNPMSDHTVLKWFSTAMVVVIMVALFLFSSQGRESQELSGVFADAFMDINVLDFSIFSAVQSGEIPLETFIHQLIRKAAHVTIFSMLGISLYVSLKCWVKHRKWAFPLTILIGALYAGSDELHQYYVPGRSGEWGDVLIDTVGVLFGTLVAMLIIRSVRKYHVNLREKGEEYMNPVPIKKQRLLTHLLIAAVLSALATACLQMALQLAHMELINTVPRQMLLIFGILLILGIIVCWIHYTTSGARFYTAVDHGLLNPDTRKPIIDIIYAILAGLMILHHFAVTLYYPEWAAGSQKLTPVWVPLAAVSVLLGRLWRHKIFWLASLFFLYTFERLFVAAPAIGGNATVYFSSALYSMFVCMAVFFVLRQSFRKTFLSVLCALWTIGALGMSAVGIYTAWAAKSVSNLSGYITFISWTGRLDGIYGPSITSGFLSVSGMVALVGFAVARHRWVKLLYLLSVFPMTLTTSLTGSRAGMAALAVAAAIMICLALQSPLKRSWLAKHHTLRAFMLILCLIIFTGGFFIGQIYLSDGFNAVRHRGGLLVSAAIADHPISVANETPIIHHGLLEYNNIDSMLTGRLTIWKSCFAYLRGNPSALISGLSINRAIETAIQREDHVHNLLIQTLMEGGMIGLLLFLSIFVVYAVNTVRILRQTDLPLWQRMLPVPVIAIFAMELTECLSHFSFGHVPMTFLWFFIGCTVSFSETLKRRLIATAEETGDD